VRQQFGGFAPWQAGFATTLESRPESLTADGPVVRLVLVARDRCPGGELARRFAVTWRLERTPQDGWVAAAVTAAATGSGTCVSA
jgi:hypothetical protein